MIDTGRMRILSERSYTAGDIPKIFWLVTDVSKYSPTSTKGLATGVMPGLSGISGDRRIVLDWFGVARNALLIMPGREVVKLNKLSRVLYDNPDYLVSNNLDAIIRLFNKTSNKAGAVQNLLDYFQEALSTRTDGDSNSLRDLFHGLRSGYISKSDISRGFFGTNPKIHTVWDLAKWFHKNIVDFAVDYLKDSVRGVSLKQYESILRAALKRMGQVYASEGEWRVKSAKFRVPPKSRLVLLRPDNVSEEDIALYLRSPEAYKDAMGERAPGFGRDQLSFGDNVLAQVREHGLHRKYRLRYTPEKRFDDRRVKLIIRRYK